ncbi:MAG TPA: peptide chain release factor N(5)-glutamine methyltransferase [Terriglobia bacterium]
MQLHQALRGGGAALENRDVPSARLAAELLLMYLLGRDRGYLYGHPELDLSPETFARYSELIAERATGKPTQYITGHQEFWGLDFEVTPDVLIPRPETEHLVEAVLDLLQTARAGRREATAGIIDVGTGSGCIALALASELPGAQIFGTDVSRPALEVARRNAERLGLSHRVQFVQMDLLAAVRDHAGTDDGEAAGFDFVVSNPPYVGSDEINSVQREVREFEPRLAWCGAGQGDGVYHRLFPQAFEVLKPRGCVAVEVGYNQADRVLDLLKQGWTCTEVRPDLAGIPRVVMARKQLPELK